LSPVGTVPSGGRKPRVIALEPSGRFAYVGNIDSNDISVFTLDLNTGTLAMLGSPVPTGSGPRSVLVGPTGNVSYTANQNSDQVSEFSINPNTGALTLLDSVSTDHTPVAPSFHPSGQYAYVANFDSSDVTIYAVDSVGGLRLLGAIRSRATSAGSPARSSGSTSIA